MKYAFGKPWISHGERHHADIAEYWENVSDSGYRRPNVLLIGAPRCATTSLACALGKHPDIFVCKPKEPHFLAMHGFESEINGMGSEAFAKRKQLTHRQWMNLFKGRKERYLVDASASTMSYPNSSIENIKKHCDVNTKLIVILRNPVERAFSSYMYCVSRGWLAGTFDEYLEREQYRIESNWQHLWFPKFLSRYELRLQPFLDAFGSESIHVAVTEEFSDDQNAILSAIFRFLDLQIVPVSTSVRYNPSGIPNSLVGDVSAFIQKRRILLKGAKFLAPTSLRAAVKNRTLSKTQMAEDARRRLTIALSDTKPWVERLIGRNLADWD